MSKGKDICKTLKRIRKEVADANEIVYKPRECHHTGPCRGTCPACEAEVRSLEQQLSLRQRLGKAVAVAGIAVSALNMHAQSVEPTHPAPSTTLPDSILLKEGEKGIIWRGKVVDKAGEPCIGASIIRTDIPKYSKMGAVADYDGNFAVEVPIGAELTFAYVGMVSVVMKVAGENPTQIMMEDGGDLMGEVVIVGGVEEKTYDDVYGRCRK